MSTPFDRSDGHYRFETPEQVDLGYDVAGLGSRFLAALVDMLILTAVVAGLTFFGATGMAFVLTQAGDLIGVSETTRVLTAIAMIVVLNFAVIWGYYVLFEIAWHGQTPGKRFISLRVIKTGGYPLRFTDSIIRNVVRLLDFLPFYYGIGVTVMVIDQHSRRLGDLAAGTLVVKERRELQLESLSTTTLPRPLMQHREQGGPPLLHVADKIGRLSPQERALLREYFARRASLTPEADDVLATKLATAFAHKLAYDLGDAVDSPSAHMFLRQLAQQLGQAERTAGT